MAQKKKKQTRRGYSLEEKARAVERARVVGATAAGREIGAVPTIVRRWAENAGVELPLFRFDKAKGVVRVDGSPTPVSGNPIPRHVEMTPPSAPDLERKHVADNENNRRQVLDVLRGEHPVDVAHRMGISASHVYQMVKALGPELSREHGLPYDPGARFGRSKLAKQRGTPADTETQLSRPEPSEALALDKPRRGRPPNSSRAEQLPLYQEPQRVTATPNYDEAERAREQAQSELKDELLRQALKEREAFKTVMEIMMREKNER